MTTPTSALGMSHIQTEFGGSNPVAISEYYGVNANVASSGLIKMSQFLGISAATIQILSRDLYTYGTYSANTPCIFHSNGLCQMYADTGASNYTFRAVGTGGDYDIKWTLNSGTTPQASTGWTNDTYLNCATTRTVYMRQTVNGILQCNLTVSIRHNANGTFITSNTLILAAEAYK